MLRRGQREKKGVKKSNDDINNWIKNGGRGGNRKKGGIRKGNNNDK